MRRPLVEGPLARARSARAALPALGLLLTVLVLDAGSFSAQGALDDDFRRVALLERFDADRDRELSDDEKRALRDAFGGVDVPLLPDQPFDYAVAVDERLRAELERADNTPADNPTTNAGVALGWVLFYDEQLSRNNTVSCASCHHQRHGFADPRRFSVGFEGGRTARNAMGLANLRYANVRGLSPGFFWDERAPTLEAQVLMPIQDELEMGMKLADLEVKLEKLPYYPALFEKAFGSPQVTSERIARALAQFLRSLVSLDSSYDRAVAAAAKEASPDGSSGVASTGRSKSLAGLTATENRGKALFMEGVGGVIEFGCAFCHIPPTFGMPKAFNNGLDAEYADRGLGALDRPSNDPLTPTNDGKFKAPSLRNIALTAPYMHDGRFATLEEVVEHYSSGVHPDENLGLAFNDEGSGDGDAGDAGAGAESSKASTSGFRLSTEEKRALVAFLKTLTDEKLIADPRFADPFVRARPQKRSGS